MDISEEIQIIWLSVFPYKESKFFSEDYKAVSFRLLNEKTNKLLSYGYATKQVGKF